MKILAFDTSNKSLALAILEDDQLLADLKINIKKNHSVSLMPAIDFLMSSVDLEPSDLDRIAVAQGPGSYTGLRVAVATAKVLAYSLKIDLVGVSSLYALAASYQEPSATVIPIINARRNNVYAGFYQNKKSISTEQYMAFSDLVDRVRASEKLVFVGEVEAFRQEIRESLPQAQIIETLPSAYQIGLRAIELPAVSVDAFVPNYLKKVEAEENWLKNHQTEADGQYIKRV
ncbi:tRNA (adenosine(37)-N6)-threonylcarbamoyltransferase complex dimerization subunit type 1 TsaB [Streptococcus catagoni]|uniref:tRNA (adenosine(37)-N6)-threonylcarbamoyltransferase complex dimerization subunit type 1 TsaB n=1 Tax=Streptococcus catagoni TaxID=2654874 RepID=UPI00140A8CAB|nr:tRNA (adenosine(37)-N6)-threonylcarbamoyltransferase complex dimerization subunit type 1 TsaB [Streptococcus catagoni]